MRHKVDMRRAIVVTGKHGMSALMIDLNEAEIKAENIPVHMRQEKTATKHLKNKGKITTVMVHVVHINETSILSLPIKEEWMQDKAEANDFRYIIIILSSLEETPVHPK